MKQMSFLELSEAARDDPAFLAEALEHGAESALAAYGFDLDGPLLAEALTNVAANLPAVAAEHLSGYTLAHSPVPFDDDSTDVDYSDPMTGIELLTAIPAHQPPDVDDAAHVSPEVDSDFGAGGGPDAELDPSDVLVDTSSVDDLDDEPTTVTHHADDPFAVLDADILDDDIPEEDVAEDHGLITDEGDGIGDGFDA